MPRLVVTGGVDEGKQFELAGERITVGRDSHCDVHLSDHEVSRHHAEIVLTGTHYRIEDRDSANGLYVNGKEVQRADLKLGDKIQMGRTILWFTDGDAPLPADIAAKVRTLTQPGEEELGEAIVQRIDSSVAPQILSSSDELPSPWLQARLANLNILYEAIQAVSHILDLDQLLDKVLELLFQSVEADRGCILLCDPNDGRLQQRACRWREGTGPRDEIAVSRTIADYALNHRQGVLISDAGADERFASGKSILRYGIREAICVPLTGRHETVGILYFDTMRVGRIDTLAKSKFNNDHLTLAVAVAHQAAMAVEETRYYQALVQAERLAAVGQAIAALSHHIKNILQGMKSGGELLKMGIDSKDDKATHTGMRLLEKNQGRIYELVLDMLSYSKDREPNYEEVELHKVVADVVELMTPRAAEQGVQIQVKLAPVEETYADAEEIHRAVLNLVTNAIEACQDTEGGRVEITLEEARSDGEILIRIRDHGSGLTGEQLASLFKPFFSTKGARGTGLGLAVSRKIVREHGGDITVISTPGQGTEFVIRLPVRREPPTFQPRG